MKITKQFSGNRIKAELASSHYCITHGISSFAIDSYGPRLQRANSMCAYTSDSELLFLIFLHPGVGSFSAGAENLCCNPESVLEFPQLRT